MLFNIIYYTCCRGAENIEKMTLDHYKVVNENDGTSYVIQATDELDKNHHEDTHELAVARCMQIQVNILHQIPY